MRVLPSMLLVASATAADPLTLVLPQTIHQPVGATTALRSGAAYAIGSEAAATWYNPALAASIDPEQLSAGATAYGFNRINVSAGRESDALISGAVLKVYGGLSGRSPDGDWGLTGMICNPVHWSGAVDSGRSQPTPTERSYASQVRVEQDTWSAQLAAGWNSHERLQAGVAVVGNYDSVDLVQNGWIRDFQGSYESAQNTDSAWSASLQAKFGLAWQPSDQVSFGASVVSPAWQVMRGGIASASTSATDPVAGTSSSSDARVEDDAFRFLHAWQIGIGAGLHEPDWDAELDLVWTLPDKTHETVPELPGFRSDTVAGVTTTTPIVVPSRVTSYRHVVNARAGGGLAISDGISLHFGGYTDFSPVAESELYNTIDFFGVSAGAMFRRKDTGVILGVSASWAHEPIDLYNPATNTIAQGQIDVFAMDFLIGTVAKF